LVYSPECEVPVRARCASRLSLIVGIVALAIVVAAPVTAAPGDLDPTFDGDGKVTTPFIFTDEARGVAIQPDGKIVAAGVAICDPCASPVKPHVFALARYNRDGSLDASFDGDGRVTTNFDLPENEAFAVAIQTDGKIIAAGYANGAGGLDFALARYNPDGSLDTTFDVDGRVITDFAGGDDRALAVAIQADGKIVAAGVAFSSACLPCDGPPTDNFGLARYNPDGSLDLTFGFGGRQVTDFAGWEDEARGVAIQSDGRIVAAGSAVIRSVDFALARYMADGSLDTSFDGDGKVTTDYYQESEDLAHAVVLQNDGRIVAGGSWLWDTVDVPCCILRDFFLARYNAVGSLDPTFDGDGKATADPTGNEDHAFGLAIQKDGKVVAAGCGRGCFLPSDASDFALARFNMDGTLDTVFGGGDGMLTTDFASGEDRARGVAIQTDGKIVAAGGAVISGTHDFALARYKVCRVSSRRSSIPCR
jgi:uncharacterized delta-60 repeat protein